jgi:hypothetical protein
MGTFKNFLLQPATPITKQTRMSNLFFISL